MVGGEAIGRVYPTEIVDALREEAGLDPEPVSERELLGAPESATVAGFLRRVRAEREARERARWSGRRLA